MSWVQYRKQTMKFLFISQKLLTLQIPSGLVGRHEGISPRPIMRDHKKTKKEKCPQRRRFRGHEALKYFNFCFFCAKYTTEGMRPRIKERSKGPKQVALEKGRSEEELLHRDGEVSFSGVNERSLRSSIHGRRASCSTELPRLRSIDSHCPTIVLVIKIREIGNIVTSFISR